MLRLIRGFAAENFWIHTIVGIIGNTSFFVGSALLLTSSTRDIAIWLFVFGSAGMLLGDIGDGLVHWEQSRLKQDIR